MKALENLNMDTSTLQSKIYDLIIKTIISIEPQVVSITRKLGVGRNNCFDLLGFDVIIDSNMKPWLLEVNLSPSMATDSPLDLYIKGNLIADTFNLVGIRYYDRKKECMSRLRSRIRARKQKIKQTETKIKQSGQGDTQKKTINNMNKYRSVIIDLFEEASRQGNFIRIYPAEGCEIYDKFFQISRASNKAVFTYLYAEKQSPGENLLKINMPESIENEKTKLIITGDDILIEYLARVLHACKTVHQEKLKND